MRLNLPLVLRSWLLLTTVYTGAGGELTDPEEGCKLEDIKHKNISRRTAMLRSQTVNTIHDVHAQGKSVQAIAKALSISRTTVRKYLKHPEAVIPKPRPPRPSKLDPYKEQIKKWVMEDHCTNCEVLFERLPN